MKFENYIYLHARLYAITRSNAECRMPEHFRCAGDCARPSISRSSRILANSSARCIKDCPKYPLERWVIMRRYQRIISRYAKRVGILEFTRAPTCTGTRTYTCRIEFWNQSLAGWRTPLDFRFPVLSNAIYYVDLSPRYVAYASIR